MSQQNMQLVHRKLKLTYKIFMCPPNYYNSIEYEINPWMKAGTNCENKDAINRWTDLKNLFVDKLGVEVFTMDPQPGLPDIIFTANAALIYKNIAVLSRFKFKERQPEEKFYKEWLENQGFKVEELPENLYFEGAGDALFSGEVLYAGYKPEAIMKFIHIFKNFSGLKWFRLSLWIRDFIIWIPAFAR
ncbi:MAG: hypothetical protein MZU79_02040 [Anaerotruncus sp.]|nr:hypothetical protein [Anaerotruncus sp.]